MTLDLLHRLGERLGPKLREERGDVPGWVMITLMSALLVAALLAVAGPRLQELFNQAIDRVSGMG
ncbi:hypothetical protein ACF046_00285 [Glutamicibacter creatinolyticus]|uniref:hypothetical protein n=1 Tax=Micrococcaceae TaxID=1268 RepID=UPI0006CFF027|nr:hypothetical protein [Arthrobacter sp. JCM 19049]